VTGSRPQNVSFVSPFSLRKSYEAFPDGTPKIFPRLWLFFFFCINSSLIFSSRASSLIGAPFMPGEIKKGVRASPPAALSLRCTIPQREKPKIKKHTHTLSPKNQPKTPQPPPQTPPKNPPGKKTPPPGKPPTVGDSNPNAAPQGSHP